MPFAILAQVETGIEWVNDLLNTYGIELVIILLVVLALLAFAVGYLYAARGDRDIDSAIANQMAAYTKQMEDNTNRNNERIDKMETKLDEERELRQHEQELYKDQISQLKDERERLKLELERSLNNEADMNNRLKLVDNELAGLRKRVADLEAERKLDKIEKEQMVREQKLTQTQLDDEKRKRFDVERERNLLEQMLSDYKRRIESLEKAVERMNVKLDNKDMELRRAYGTIATLTGQLSHLTEDTGELPDFEITTDDDGNEVVTPVIRQGTTNETPENDNDNDNGNEEIKDAA